MFINVRWCNQRKILWLLTMERSLQTYQIGILLHHKAPQIIENLIIKQTYSNTSKREERERKNCDYWLFSIL